MTTRQTKQKPWARRWHSRPVTVLLSSLLVAGACLTGAGLSLTAADPHRPPGLSSAATPVSAPSAAAPSTAPPDPTTPAPQRPAAPTHTTSPTRSPAATVAPSVPERISIPAISVDGPVMSVGLQPDGTLEVPPIEADAPAGWYRGSPEPGAPGPSVIVGHVTVGSYGKGIFYRLSQLTPGAQIIVERVDGSSVTFTVTKVAEYPKSVFPTESVYGNTAGPSLRLITCSGPRDQAEGYLDNLIVYADIAAIQQSIPAGRA